MRRSTILGLILSASVLVAVPAAVAQSCRDADRDGYQVGAGCGGGADCDDGNLDVFPGAPELCNGRDDDCDGSLDEGCDRVCENGERRLWGGAIDDGAGLDQMAPVISPARRGFGLAWSEYQNAVRDCEDVLFGRFDERGNAVVGPIALGRKEYAGNDSGRRKVVVRTGEQFWVGWNGEAGPQCLDTTRPGPQIQRISSSGKLIGAAIEPACESGSSLGHLIWTGRHFVVSFTGTGGLYLARIGPDGTVQDPCGISIGPTGYPTAHGMATNGERLAIVYTALPAGAHAPEGYEVYLKRVTSDLQNLDPGGRRLTFTVDQSREPSVTWGPGEWGVSWAQYFPGQGEPNIAFARVRTDGSVIDPPGIVQVTDDAVEDRFQEYPQVIWTGEEYGIVYKEHFGLGLVGDLFLARVTPAGQVIESRRLMTDDARRDADWRFDAYWNGEDYSFAWGDFTRLTEPTSIRVDRLGCGCADADGDHYTSCAGGDCDDTRADINLTRPELCGDGLDNNCDGQADCADVLSCPAQGPAPGAVIDLLASSDHQTFSWDAASGAESYDVLRGRAVDLVFEGNLSHAGCLAKDLLQTSVTDIQSPLVSDAFVYLARGAAGAPSACRLGTWGTSERDQTIVACP